MQFTQAHKEEIRVQNILKDILAQSPDVQPDDELTEQLVQEDIIQLPKTGGSSTWIWGSSLIIALIGRKQLTWQLNLTIRKIMKLQLRTPTIIFLSLPLIII